MKSNRLKLGRLCGVAAALFMIAFWAVSRELPASSGQLMISSITAQGTNIVLTVNVPSGFSLVSLEMRTAMDTPWLEAGVLDIPANGGTASYTMAKPGEMAFFRLKGTLAPTPSTPSPDSMVSSEVNYVVVAPLGMSTSADAEGLTADGQAVFHFKGTIDGSDKIVITREGAFWEHVNWSWPQKPVSVNNTAWNPREKNFMTTLGSVKFLSEKFSLEDATLAKLKGRDLIAVERGDDALIVYLNDVQNGAADYEFKLYFPPAQPKPARTASTSATLKISANVDGYDTFQISASGVTWKAGGRRMPTAVKLNDVSWSLEQTNVLQNEGTNTFLPAGVDFSTAKILSRKGRDVATMLTETNSILVQFADNPNGSDDYELEIGFGR